MTRGESNFLTTQVVSVAITDPYLSQIRVIEGRMVKHFDTGRIPSDVVAYCDKMPEGQEG